MSLPVIVIPDAVEKALPYLRAAMATSESVTIGATVPASRPDRFIQLRLAGGTRTINNIFGRPRIDALAWALSEYDALELVRIAEAHLLAAPGRVTGVSRATPFLGPIPNPDPDSEAPRALATVEWQVRGTQQ